MLSSEGKGLPFPQHAQECPARWSWTDTEHSPNPAPCVEHSSSSSQARSVTAYCSGLASSGAGNSSRAIPQTQTLLTQSEGKPSERTAVLSHLVLEFKINTSKIMILGSKDSLSLWYLLVPNFWNSPGLVAMLFCARFPVVYISIKDRSEGSLQSHSSTCLLQIFFQGFPRAEHKPYSNSMTHTKTWVSPFNRHWPDLYQTQTLFLIGFVGLDFIYYVTNWSSGELATSPIKHSATFRKKSKLNCQTLNNFLPELGYFS